jgi:RNA polymerase subunit RPABC4/transcription elongation factor Spt4
MNKKCSICGEILDKGKIECPNCRRGVFSKSGGKKIWRALLLILFSISGSSLALYNEQLLKQLYNAPGSELDFKIQKGKTAVIGRYGWYADADITIVMESGEIKKITPTSAKQVNVFQIYLISWLEMDSNPYLHHVFNKEGVRIGQPVLVVHYKNKLLVGPCQTLEGKELEGLPIVGDISGQNDLFFTFNVDTSEGKSPLQDAPSGKYRLPPLPIMHSEKGGPPLVLVLVITCAVIIVSGIGGWIFIRRRRQKQS